MNEKSSPFIDPDSPPLTPERAAKLRRLDPAPLVSETFKAWREGRLEPLMKRRLPVSLDPEVFEHFQALGDDWEDRMNVVLRDAIEATTSGVLQSGRKRA